MIGGGYIGLEMGTVYAELGSEVTVVELLDGLLPGADRDLVKPLEKRLRERFAGIHLGTKVVELKDAGDKVDVRVEGAEFNGTHSFDRVLVSIGRRPVTSGIGLENTKVKVNDSGFVVVNEQAANGRPAHPGDRRRGRRTDARPQSVARRQSRGRSAGRPSRPRSSRKRFRPSCSPIPKSPGPASPWTKPKRAGRDVAIAAIPVASQRPGHRHRPHRRPHASGSIDPTTDRVLGCGIVGAGAGELIAEAVVAIEMGCTVRDVADSIHPHPTLSETLSFAADVYLGTATEVYRPKRK